MCGIAGFVDFNADLTKNSLIQMTDALEKRGPDGGGYSFFTHSNFHLGLGHRRLSIIDLSLNGKQPMSRHKLHITFNGEIYNYQEIKQELQKRGHNFSSTSDTEVILIAFKEWGKHAISRLNGMFSFVLYDENEDKLYFIRDRAGVKPLYIYHKNNVILFASELKSLHHIEGFKKEIDSDALASYFQYGYIPTPHCIFKNVRKLKEGHILTLDLKSKEETLKPYWQVQSFVDKKIIKLKEEEIILETEKIFQKSFQYRMISDVPVGLFLSGGYDSSLVSALLQSASTNKIKTFTIGFENQEFDESDHAEKVANYLGTDHKTLLCTETEAKEIIPKLPIIFDEPFGDSSAIPTYLVSKMASSEVKVVLSADGGDEQFMGYQRHVNAFKLAQLMKLFGPKLSKRLGHLGSSLPLDRIKRKIVLAMADGHISNIPLFQTQTLHQEELAQLLNHSFKTSLIQKPKSKSINSLFATEYLHYMQDDILTKVDRTTMYCGIEGREPLLDYSIAEWMLSLPIEMKYKKKTLKYIIKEITHKYIPEELMKRPKQGFGVPIYQWLRKDLAYLIPEYINEKSIVKHGLLNWKYVKKELDLFTAGSSKSNLPFIWYTLVFQMWYEKWMT